MKTFSEQKLHHFIIREKEEFLREVGNTDKGIKQSKNVLV